MKDLRVAVVIVTWNSSTILNGVLKALAQQTFKPNRVLVIDNGSDDSKSTAALVDDYDKIELIALSENSGFAAANNLGIMTCSDMDYIALLNPDAFPERNWLANFVSAISSNPEFSNFASRLINHENRELLDGAGDAMSIHGKPKRRGHGDQAKDNYVHPEPVFCPSAAAALYKRSALLEVGGFDEDYFCYLEDVDLGFRLQLSGYKAMYVPNAIVYHIGSATTGGQHSDFSVYHGHRNLVWTFIKNMPGVLFWLLLPLHVLLNIVTLIIFVARGQTAVIFRAKWHAIMAISRMWSKRKQIQNKRVASVGYIWRALDKSIFKK
jgi:GT2 family glycosyltransferase